MTQQSKTRLGLERLLGLLMVVAMTAALGAACTTTGTGGDGTNDAVKNAQRDLVSEALGIPRSAINAFDQAAAELAKDDADVRKAETLLKKALGEAPNFLEAQYNMGIVAERLGQYDAAIQAYTKAQSLDKLNTHSGKILLAIGRAQSLSGKSAEAIKTFEEALRLDPENLDVLNSVGAAYLKAKRHDEAVEYVKKVLREENNNVTALNTLAQIYAAQNNMSMSLYVFRKAARASLGATTSDEERSAEPAWLVLDPKLYKAERVKDKAQAADIFNNLGQMYIKDKKMPEAVACFQAAAKVDAADVESRLNIGAVYIEYLNYAGAKQLFQEVLNAAPGHCTATLGFAASAYGLGERPVSAKHYETYLAQCDQKSAPAHMRLVQVYEREQEFDKAIAHCKDYVALANPKEGEPITGAYCDVLKNMKEMQNNPQPGPEELPPEEGGEPPAEGGGGEGEPPAEEGGAEEAPPAGEG